jgi:hypothetical protein
MAAIASVSMLDLAPGISGLVRGGLMPYSTVPFLVPVVVVVMLAAVSVYAN